MSKKSKRASNMKRLQRIEQQRAMQLAALCQRSLNLANAINDALMKTYRRNGACYGNNRAGMLRWVSERKALLELQKQNREKN